MDKHQAWIVWLLFNHLLQVLLRCVTIHHSYMHKFLPLDLNESVLTHSLPSLFEYRAFPQTYVLSRKVLLLADHLQLLLGNKYLLLSMILPPYIIIPLQKKEYRNNTDILIRDLTNVHGSNK